MSKKPPSFLQRNNEAQNFSDYGYFVLTEVTPELAQRWLESKARNRNVTRGRVIEYARAMTQGQWRVTHQGIAFDADENLTDGQHRLEAVVTAKVPVLMWVYYGLPQDDMIVVDKHRPRSEQNSLFISGHDVTNNQVQAARAMYAIDRTSSYSQRLVGDDLLTFLNKHKEAIDFSCRIFSSNTKGVTCASNKALVARAFYHCDPIRLEQFGRVLVTGMPIEGNADSAAIRFRNWLMETNTGIGLSGMIQTVYRRGSYALMNFMEGKPIQRLAELNKDLFPLPESNP